MSVLDWFKGLFNFVVGLVDKIAGLFTSIATEDELKAAVELATSLIEKEHPGSNVAVASATVSAITLIDAGQNIDVSDAIDSALDHISGLDDVEKNALKLFAAGKIEKLLETFFTNAEVLDAQAKLATVRKVLVWVNNASGGTAV